MPRACFVAAWAFLATVLVSAALSAVGYLGPIAFEIIVSALVFGWIAVFIRMLGVAGGPDPMVASSRASATAAHHAAGTRSAPR